MNEEEYLDNIAWLSNNIVKLQLELDKTGSRFTNEYKYIEKAIRNYKRIRDKFTHMYNKTGHYTPREHSVEELFSE